MSDANDPTLAGECVGCDGTQPTDELGIFKFNQKPLNYFCATLR